MAKNDAKKNKQAEPEQTPDTQIQQQTAEPCEAAPVPEVGPETAEQAVSETEQLRQELAEEKDRYLRLAAEYDNFRKRSVKEKEAIYPEAAAEAISKFLPVLDSMERAAGFACSDEEYKKGVDMIIHSFYEALAAAGAEEISAEVGAPFDPALHNAVMHIEDENLGTGVISQVFQKGYRLGDRIIRHSMVQVAN